MGENIHVGEQDPTESEVIATLPSSSPAWLKRLHDLAFERVTGYLTAAHNGMGPMTRDELGAFLDGAQEAVMEWTPPAKRQPTPDELREVEAEIAADLL